VLPISVSPLAEIVPTWAILSSEVTLTGVQNSEENLDRIENLIRFKAHE